MLTLSDILPATVTCLSLALRFALCLSQLSAPVAQPGFAAVAATLMADEISRLRTMGEAGDVASQMRLATAYDDGNGVGQDPGEAARWYRKAAENGNAEAQNILGNMYRAGRGLERNKETAVAWYRKAILQGNGRAMFNLATAYYNGDGVSINDPLAYAWFTLALEHGSSNAQDAISRMNSELKPWQLTTAFVDLGHIYEEGEQGPKNLIEAAKWYRKAAEAGDLDVQASLGLVLLNGTGLKQDFVEARHWCETAAKRNSDLGMCCVGMIHQRGLGVPRDSHEAAKWYRSAAELDNVTAMELLGEMYASGDGVKTNRVTAYLWFIRAASKDSKAAFEDAIKLRPLLTKKELDSSNKQLRAMGIDPAKLDAYIQKFSTGGEPGSKAQSDAK